GPCGWACSPSRAIRDRPVVRQSPDRQAGRCPRPARPVPPAFARGFRHPPRCQPAPCRRQELRRQRTQTTSGALAARTSGTARSERRARRGPVSFERRSFGEAYGFRKREFLRGLTGTSERAEYIRSQGERRGRGCAGVKLVQQLERCEVVAVVVRNTRLSFHCQRIARK